MYNSELLFSSCMKLPSQFVYLRICLTERLFIIVLTMPSAFTVCSLQLSDKCLQLREKCLQLSEKYLGSDSHNFFFFETSSH